MIIAELLDLDRFVASLPPPLEGYLSNMARHSH